LNHLTIPVATARSIECRTGQIAGAQQPSIASELSSMSAIGT
jgi:hypothetical protein